MLALLPHGREVERIRSSLPVGRDVVVVEDWRELERTLNQIDCSTVRIVRLRGDPLFSGLASFKNRHPFHPVVLITRFNRGNARRIKDVFVEEVVWSREVRQDLKTAVGHACSREFNFMRCLAVPLEEAEHLPFGLRRALAYACRSESPVTEVQQLSAATGYDRRRLARYWGETVALSGKLHLSDFLRWLVLLRVVGQKVPGENWAEAAEALDVHPHTLGRYAKEYAGRTLPELEGEGKKELVNLFRKRVLAFLLEEDGLDTL